MMKTFTAAIIVCIVLLVSCKKETPELATVPQFIIGSWVNPSYADSVMFLEKASGLDENGYGFTINTDGTFIERKNSGFCATPPVFYENFDGHWVLLNATMEISVAYWGGMANYLWKLELLDNNKLKVTRISEKYYQALD